MDGANNNDVGSNRTILIYPSVDAIEEFKIHRNSYGAEFGQAAGAQVNIVTRGGTNEFHGSAFYFGRDDALNATNYFLKQANQDKENLSRHDFGYTFGGPLIKDKLHFFVSQEWNREQRGTVRARSVPTRGRADRRLQRPAEPAARAPTPNDPLTGQPFPGNRIPANRLSPGGLAVPAALPAAQHHAHRRELQQLGDVAGHARSTGGRRTSALDWTVSNSTRLMLRYTQDSWENGAPSTGARTGATTRSRPWTPPGTSPASSLVAQLNQNIGVAAINTLHFSYSGNKHHDHAAGGDDPELNDQINAAIPPALPGGSSATATTAQPPGASGAAWATARRCGTRPRSRTTRTCSSSRTTTPQVFGKHYFKVGGPGQLQQEERGRRRRLRLAGLLGPHRPQRLGRRPPATCWPTSCCGTWRSASRSSPPTARPSSAGTTSRSTSQTPGRSSPRVTFDLGLRWSNYYAAYHENDRVTSFDPALFNPALGNDPCNGLIYPPGTNPCAEAGLPGRLGRGPTGPSWRTPPTFRAPPRRRLGRLRQRQDRRPRGAGPLLPA